MPRTGSWAALLPTWYNYCYNKDLFSPTSFIIRPNDSFDYLA